MSRFLRFCAFLSVLFFSANAMAAGYLCPTYRKYTSCNAGYYMTYNGAYNATAQLGNSCTICPAGKYCTGGTAAPVNVNAGYYSTGGGTSATPTAAGNGCLTGKSCGPIAAGRWGAAGATTAQGSGAVNAGYYSTGGGTSATPTAAGNGCISGKSCGPIAAGRWGAAGATTAQGSGAVNAGYYSTGGGTSATPTAAGNGCISGKSCGKVKSGCYTTSTGSTTECPNTCPGSMTSAAGSDAKTDCFINCNVGNYLPKNTSACATCTVGNYCIGGNMYFSTTTDYGLSTCSGDFPGSTSHAGAGSFIDCYKTVILNKNGGTGYLMTLDALGFKSEAGGTDPLYLNCYFQQSCALPSTSSAITQSGYTFQGGWNTSAGCTSGINSISGFGDPDTDSSHYSATGPFTYYACKTPNKPTITLDGNGATSAGTTTIYSTYNTNVYLDSARSKAMTTSANAITKPTRSYTVTYNANGGSVSPTSATAAYTFGGYYSSESSNNGTGTQYLTANGNITSNGLTAGKGYASNATWYAKWTSASVTLPTPTRTGYIFKGWSTSSTATSGVTGSYTPTSNVTLYATWEKDKYTVKYFCGDEVDSIPNGGSDTVSYGDEYEFRAYTCQKTGYTQIGWSDNDGHFGVVNAGDSVTWSVADHVDMHAVWSANCNAITLNNTAHGGSGGTTTVYKKTGSTTWYSDSSCSSTKTITSVTKPTKTNATYAGTYTTNATSGGTQCITSAGALSTSTNCNVTGPTTWYARYTCNAGYQGSGTTITGACSASTYTITLNDNNGSGGLGTVKEVYATKWTNSSGTTITSVTLPTRSGYVFNGYYTAASGGTQRITNTGALPVNTTFTANTTLYAQWTACTCTKGSNVSACSVTGTNASNQCTYSYTCTTGYHTSGTFNGTAGTAANTSPNCTINTFTVAFNSNKPSTASTTMSGSMSNQSFTYGTAQNLTANAFSLPGYTFAGWATSATGAVVHTDKKSVSNLTTTNGGTVTLYAKWTPNTYTVTFKSGSSILGTQSFTFDTAQNLTKVANLSNIPVSSANGWSFYGWSTGADYTAEHTDGKSVSNLTTTSGGNVDLYAVWSRPVTFKYYSSATATSVTTSTRTQYYYKTSATAAGVNGVSTYALATQSSYNWAPVGWVLNSNTSTAAVSTATTTTGTVTPPASGPAVYTALYRRTATLSYNGNGSTSGSTANTTGTQYYNVGNGSANTLNLTLATNGFSKTGHTFSKWAAGSTSGTQHAAGASYAFPNEAWNTTGSYTMYAIWTVNKYTVSFNANGGSGGQSADVTATYNNAMPTISTTKPTRAGYVFMGWYDNATYTSGTQYYTAAGASARTYNKTSNTTLYAGWAPCTAGYYCPAGSTSVTQNKCPGLYVNSLAASDANTDCYFTTTAGKYLVASTDTAQTECPVGQYCTAETLNYPNVSELNSGGGWNDCPAVSGRQMTTFPDNYKVYDTNTTSIYSSTVSVVSVTLQKWSKGQTSASQCRAVYTFSNDAGTLIDESVWYNPNTDKYDSTSANPYYTSLKGGYYAMTRYSATYCDNRKETDTQKTLYRKAVVCPANSYCPAVSSFPKCYGNEYTETYNNNLCTSLGSFYTTSAKGASAASQCYGTTTAGKYIATANSSTQTTCPAGSYCPATNVYYGKYGTSAGGQNLCPAGKYNAATGKSLSTDCIECARGSYAVGTGNSSCTACTAGTTTTSPGHTSATCSLCANNNDYDNAWETPSWSANAVTNLCKVKNCKAGSKYSSAAGTNTTGSCTACGTGTYMASSAHTNTTCTSASKGYYVNTTAATGQTACTGAEYQDATGQTSCKSCPSGYTANTTNAKTAATQCQISCAAGTRVAEKAAACTSPAGGWFTTATHLVNYNNVSNVNYCMAGFSSSSTAATGHDAKADCTQSVAGGKYIPATTIQARYIKVTTAGSTANAGSHVVEIQAFASADGSGTNLLSGKGGVSGSNMTAATDGSWAIGNYASGTMVWDMGSAQALGSIKFALYTDGRVYSDVTVSVSTDNSTWTTVLGPVDVATSNTSTATPEMIVLSAAPASCAAGEFKAAASVALGSTTTCGTCANWTYSGSGAASCTSCPTVESGYAKLDSTGTGWTTYTKCVEIASASPSNCSAGKLQKIPTASGATTWASPTVNSSNPLSAKAGYYVSGTQCAACGDSNYYCTGGTAARKTVTTGYYSTGGTSTTRTGQSQCTGSTYCESGEQKNCPTAETNWTLGTGTGWSAVTSCFETRAATNVSSNCSAGQLKKNATSSATWPTSASISVAFQADPGSIVSGQTCVQCTGATYSAGGTATQCSACDTNYQANTSAGKSVATQCQTKCAAGTAVVTENNACADIKNSTYKGKFTTEHLVNYGSKSSISTCPTPYQDGNGTTAQANCINSCAAGTQVAAANADCSTPSNTTYGASWYTSAHNVTYGKTSKSMSLVGSCPSTYTTPDTTTASNHDAKSDCTTTCAAGKVVASTDAACSVPNGSWYSAQHTVSAGSTSGTNKKSCNSGYATANTTTQTDHDAAADCKISCSAGYYIPTAGEGCKVCTAGKYCSAISNIAQTSTSAVTGNVNAGYWNNGCGTNATGSVCSTSYSGGLIAAGYYGAAGATASTGAGMVSGGYYSTGGGTSATPSSNGNGCVGTGNTCGKLSAAYYSNGGSTTNGATCVSGKVCGTCDSNYRANTNTGKTAVTQCQTKCAAGTAVVTENNACADIKNSTYKGKYTPQHNVAYGSVSTIQSCPTYYQDSSVGVAGEANCINSCAAGTQVATANADCSTPNTANWYTDAHDVTYGKTSANLNKVVSCDSDYGNSGTTAANHAGVTSCKVTCPAGTWVASANAACTDVTSGYYRTTSETVSQTKTGTRSACTDLGAIYNASDSGRDETTDCFAMTNAKKWVASAKATAESTCTEGYYCGGGTKVYYNSTGGRKECEAGSFCVAGVSEPTACAVGSYTSTTGQSACTACTNGKTTSEAGKTSCDATCANASGANAWSTASWTNNTVANLCTISKCNANTYYTATTATGYKNTCTGCGANSSTSAGNTSTTCTCTTGYTAANGNISAGSVNGSATTQSGACSLISDIACAIGQYVPAKATSCSACTAGYYCPSTAKTYSYSSSIQGRTACSPGTYQPDTGKTSCVKASLGYHVRGSAQTEQTACSGATYAATEGQAECTSCPTAKNPSTDKVIRYGYWISGNGPHTERAGCQAFFDQETLTNGTMKAYCFVDADEDKDTYGIDGTAKSCYVLKDGLKCNGGYYNEMFNSSSTATQQSAGKTLDAVRAMACVPVTAGYWSANESLNRTACATGLTTIGYGTAANEAEDCGRKLHAGNNVVYLRSGQRSTPTLKVKIGDDVFYGALSTSLSGALKVKKGTTEYSVVNDWQ